MTSTFDITLVTDRREFDTLAESWQTLADSSPTASVFSTWYWISAWWKHFGDGVSPFIIVARDTEGNLVGVAPLVRHRRGPFRVLKFLGAPHSDYHEFLFRPHEQPLISAAICKFLLGLRDEWDVWEVNDVTASSPLWPLIEEVFADEFEIHPLRDITCPYAALPDDWGTFLGGLSRKRGRYIRNRLEYLERIGVGYRTATRKDAITETMDHLYLMHVERWRNRKCLNPVHGVPHFLPFLKEAAMNFNEAGCLALAEITTGHRPMAIALNFRYKTKVYNYLRGFDIAWHSYSPGLLLDVLAIKQAIESYCREYDFARGDEDYKRTISNRLRVNRHAFVTRRAKSDLMLAAFVRSCVVWDKLAHRRGTGRLIRFMSKYSAR
ncbi:MAG TPA: GNAT family N-acetyltransferase [Pyrinomonadaceae bacterium]